MVRRSSFPSCVVSCVEIRFADTAVVRSERPLDQELKLAHQLTVLHAFYYTLITCTHRSFISSPTDPIETNSPSLALCTNAARQCVRMLHGFTKRYPEVVSQWFYGTAMNVGMILMLNLWMADPRSKGATRAMYVEDIHKSAEVIRIGSYR